MKAVRKILIILCLLVGFSNVLKSALPPKEFQNEEKKIMNSSCCCSSYGLSSCVFFSLISLPEQLKKDEALKVIDPLIAEAERLYEKGIDTCINWGTIFKFISYDEVKMELVSEKLGNVFFRYFMETQELFLILIPRISDSTRSSNVKLLNHNTDTLLAQERDPQSFHKKSLFYKCSKENFLPLLKENRELSEVFDFQPLIKIMDSSTKPEFSGEVIYEKIVTLTRNLFKSCESNSEILEDYLSVIKEILGDPMLERLFGIKFFLGKDAVETDIRWLYIEYTFKKLYNEIAKKIGKKLYDEIAEEIGD